MKWLDETNETIKPGTLIQGRDYHFTNAGHNDTKIYMYIKTQKLHVSYDASDEYKHLFLSPEGTLQRVFSVFSFDEWVVYYGMEIIGK